jgi:uncharacterized protein with GYD domain
MILSAILYPTGPRPGLPVLRVGGEERFQSDERRIAMPLYIMLSNLTSDGLETIRKKPDRIREVEEELKEMGVEIKGQWAVLGEYDFVNLVEAPDNLTVARASVQIGSRGSVSIVTMPAIPVEDFINSMK